MSATGVALAEWIEQQPVSSDRLRVWIAADFYRCAIEVGQVADYLDGAEIDTLVQRTVSALPLLKTHELNPADLIYLPQVHLMARRHPDRRLTAGVWDALAAAFYAALVERGVPTEVRQPVREELAAARDLVVNVVRPAGHPYLWSRPGR